jgi:hypothetical protein
MKCDHLCTKCGAHEQYDMPDVLSAPLVERQLCLRCEGSFYAMQAADFKKHGRPRTDEEYCAHLARFFVRFEPSPWTEIRIVNTAACMAEGGFGPEFAAADYGQKSAWIDLCERALRSELEAAGSPASGG